MILTRLKELEAKAEALRSSDICMNDFIEQIGELHREMDFITDLQIRAKDPKKNKVPYHKIQLLN